jgi:uncharacterized protein YjbJ (UPF0337 family)
MADGIATAQQRRAQQRGVGAAAVLFLRSRLLSDPEDRVSSEIPVGEGKSGLPGKNDSTFHARECALPHQSSPARRGKPQTSHTCKGGRLLAIILKGCGPGRRCRLGAFASFPTTNREEDSAMNWDQMQGSWKQLKGNVKERWGRLTDDDLDRIDGRREQLVGQIQEKYGIAQEVAQEQVQQFLVAFQEMTQRPGKEHQTSQRPRPEERRRTGTG